MSVRTDEELALAYRESVGREPGRLPDDHQDRWQWEYRGSKDERETLLDRLCDGASPVEQDALPGIAA